MAAINPWINFNGNAEEAFTFYQSVFGGEFVKVVRFKDLASTEFPVAKEDENKIMHIAFTDGQRNIHNFILFLFWHWEFSACKVFEAYYFHKLSAEY